MDRDRWGVIQGILARALEAEAEEIPALLAECCGDDVDMRLEVESLLAASAGADEYFGGLADRAGIGDLQDTENAPTAETIDEDGTLDLTGRRVGAYRLVRLIGRGGMGTVYLAERADGQFEHRVALKLLPLGTAASRDAHRRFLAERGILARLEHPNIARLLDGGVLEDGTPYFVLEFVDGIRIDHYCDENQLTVQERLRLFLRVCEAVSHAHHSLVVHRDLKPANILVAQDDVKLLDFGIAKLIGPEESLGLTAAATGFAPMTPAFASPEQLRGEPITTATDVYALGVVLHELLSGLSPYRMRDATAGAMIRAICEQDVVAPSSRLRRFHEGAIKHTGEAPADAKCDVEAISAARQTTPSALVRKLKGDLDTIVLKALRKEPQRRYDSVGRLVDDIRRHLDGYPVLARKESWTYRTSRFFKRHKVAAGMSAAAMIFLVAFLGTAAWFSISNAAQARRIAQERDRAQEALQIMAEMYAAADPAASPGETVTAREMLADAVERLNNEQTDPETRSQLLLAAGRVYRRLSSTDARPLLEESLQIRRELYEAPHMSLAESAYELGSHYYLSGDTQDGIDMLEEALAQYVELTGENSLEVARARYQLGTALHDAGQHGPSGREFQQAVQIFKQHPPTETTEHADTLVQLANYVTVTGAVDDGRVMLEEALALNEKLRGPEHPSVAMNLSSLGMIYWNQGDAERGIASIRRAVELNRKVYGSDPGHSELATTLHNLGQLLASQGAAEGLDLLREAVQMHERLAIEPLTRGFTITSLANAYRDNDEPLLAEDAYEEALRVYAEEGATGLPVANTKLHYSRFLEGVDRIDRAIDLLEEALAEYEAALPDDHPRVVQVRAKLEELRGAR